jgi:hypothetical protein
MMRPPPRSYRPVTIPVLHCTAWQDIKAKPTRSLSYNGAFHQLWGRPGTNHSPRYTALLAVFAWRCLGGRHNHAARGVIE